MSYMALTAHFAEETALDLSKSETLSLLSGKAVLLAFRSFPLSHSGENIAREVFKIIEDAGLAERVHLSP